MVFLVLIYKGDVFLIPHCRRTYINMVLIACNWKYHDTDREARKTNDTDRYRTSADEPWRNFK